MRRRLTIALVAAATLAQSLAFMPAAMADLASFESAFTQTCLKALPDLERLETVFRNAGWTGFSGADAGEFEFYKDGTAVYLRAVPLDEQPGCTVMDAAVSPLEGEWILELALDKYFAGSWETGVGHGGQKAWFLDVRNNTVTFYVTDGIEGGASISLEVRP